MRRDTPNNMMLGLLLVANAVTIGILMIVGEPCNDYAPLSEAEQVSVGDYAAVDDYSCPPEFCDDYALMDGELSE